MTTRPKTIYRAITLMSLAVTAAPVGAATLEPTQTGYPTLRLTPSQTTVAVGESFAVEIVISGLLDAGISGLSAFDIGVGAVPTLFSVDSYAVGTTLGDPSLGQSVDTSAGQTGPNTFHVGQSSNLSADYLSSQLPDSFVLATLQYIALDVTPACNCIVIAAEPQLYDGFGNMFIANVINEGVTVTVVPVPAAFWLLVAGLAVVPRRRPTSKLCA